LSTTITFKRGTRAELDLLAVRRGLSPGEPFLITDEGRFALATSDRTYTAFASETETGGSLGQVVTITRSLTLNAVDWQDTGIVYSNLASGTYILEMYANDTHNVNQWYSGLMNWNVGGNYGSGTDPSDEVLLNSAGSSNQKTLYLRTFRTNDSTGLKLQIYSSYTVASSYNYVFKFRAIV
jgi:hypothetical protein